MKTDRIVATLTFVPDEEVNKRGKAYKLAKFYSSKDGVASAEIGTVSVEGRDHVGSKSEVVQVRYSDETIDAGKSIGSPLSVKVAYFDRNETVVAAHCVSEDKEFVVFGSGYSARIVGSEAIEIGGEAKGGVAVYGMIRSCLGDDGDQLGKYRSDARKKQYEKEKLEEHLARVASAYAEREKRGGMGYRSARVLERCPVSPSESEESRREYGSRTRSIIAELRSHYEKEIWSLCEKSVGKLRCESPLAYFEGDQYSFATLGEIAYYLTTKWVREGWSDEIELRRIFAEDFVREYLS